MLIPLFLRSRAVASEVSSEVEALEQQLSSILKGKAQLEEDQKFLTQFMKEFPHLARDLFNGLKERQVPPSVLHVVQRSLDPAQVVVLVRRGTEEGLFVVAAASPEAGTVRVGDEVRSDVGEVGFAAEARIVVGRDDLADDTTKSRIKPAPNAFTGFLPELFAPLVFDQETLGMVVLSKPRKASGEVKAALRLIAQTGAQALHNAAAYTQIKVTAEMDGLTRIFNKKHMEQGLGELIYRTACAAYDRRDQGGGQGPAQTLSVFLFDIDHFKHYNDTNGHLAGDKLLQELARIVPEAIRKDDTFGRFGGEEFLLILPNTNLAQSLAAANKIRALIAAHPFAFADRQPMKAITVSGGVAEYPYHGRDAQSLLHAADEALYEAKRQGRNRVAAAAAARAGAAAAPLPANPVPPEKPAGVVRSA
ncbi:MAG TPA: sensor domain-containing diguanylate cyclase [Vicinamibacteria bacterium]